MPANILLLPAYMFGPAPFYCFAELVQSLAELVLYSRPSNNTGFHSSTVHCPAGARLTAFELVHDGLPATLICDSAAAALMAAGQVDAVVVGADRCVELLARAAS